MDGPQCSQRTAGEHGGTDSTGYTVADTATIMGLNAANADVGLSANRADIVDLSADGAAVGLIADGADIVGLGADGVASTVDPAEEAMSVAIVSLQEVTADLTGRLASQPEHGLPGVSQLRLPESRVTCMDPRGTVWLPGDPECHDGTQSPCAVRYLWAAACVPPAVFCTEPSIGWPTEIRY